MLMHCAAVCADPAHQDPAFRASCRTKIYLGYTSNLISAGVREQIRWLVQHKMVDVLVTTAGGIEEDFIKCMGHTYMGDFQLKGEQGLSWREQQQRHGSATAGGMGATGLDSCH